MKILINKVSYTTKGKKILQDVSFGLKEGEVLAVLGENGSGKSTLIEIIAGLIKPSDGNILFNDNRSRAYDKRAFGFLWDDIHLFPWLKVKEAIHYLQTIYSVSSDGLLHFDYLGINAMKNTFMGKLSKGEKKRISIILSTMHHPKVLIMDEPTSELDPTIRSVIWKNTLMSLGRSILFTTHMWEEAKMYADRIVFLYNGRVLVTPDRYDNLLASVPFSHKIITNKEITRDIHHIYPIIENKSERIFFVHGIEDPFISKIKDLTMNYTVFPLTLEDVYHYYKNVSS